MPNEQHPKSDGTTFGDKAQNNAVVKTVQGDFVYNAAAAKLYARHQLRKPLDDFTGREKEIEELLAKLRQGGRASITGISGMSGIGKTELALIVADRLREDYPDAQLFLEMRGIDEKPLAPAEALASSIRAFEGPEVPLPDDINELKKIYLSVLSDKRALVVLDNAADQNQMRLLTPPAGCAMLVTSRNIIAGMDRITLDQLSLKEARELLISICDRITPELADQIADLCGYLPLALRAAGSMLDVMVDLDVVDYVKQLFEERTRLETIGAEGVEIGVEASFNLSYLRLDTEVARVFRALCIFPGSFDAQAEEAICEDAAHKHLSDLVKRSLVLFDKASKRYRLHDLIRVFADKCLPDKERLTKQHEHAEHYLRVLADADDLYEKGGPFIQQALTLFDSEWLNAEAGWKWARRNNITNQRALELCTLYPDVSTYISEFKLPPGERIVRRKVALAAARGLGIKESEGWHLSNLGIAYMHSGQIKRANDIFKQHLQIVRNLGDRTAEGIVLLSLGLSCFELGELQQAIKFYEQALGIMREVGDRRRESAALSNLGGAYSELGEVQKAIECLQQSLVITRETGDHRGEGATLGSLGNAYLKKGDPTQAISFFQQHLTIASENGDRREVSLSLNNLGLAYAKFGEPQAAIVFYEQVLPMYEETGDERNKGITLTNLGNAYLDIDETQRAVECYEKSLQIAHKTGDRKGEAYSLFGLAKAAHKRGDLAQSYSFLDASIEVDVELKDPESIEWREALKVMLEKGEVDA